MILPFNNIGYKHLSENKRFPNHRWYSDATWGKWVNVLHWNHLMRLRDMKCIGFKHQRENKQNSDNTKWRG
jgi:hypothetical protein